MKKAFKFRFVNQLTGSFVLLCGALFVGSIFYAGGQQGWFEKEFEFVGLITGAEGSFGLTVGNEVRLSDTKVGSVQSVEPLNETQVRVVCLIKDRYRRYLRVSSTLEAKKEFMLTGDASLEIHAGKTGELLPEGGVIAITQNTGFMEIAQQTMEDIQGIAGPLVEKVDKILGHIEALSGSIAAGKGAVGALLTDPETESHVKHMIAELDKTATGMPAIITEAEALMARAQSISEKLDAVAGSATNVAVQIGGAADDIDAVMDDVKVVSGVLRKESEDLNGLVFQAQETLREIERLTEGLQKHWFVKKYMDDDAPVRIISPQDAARVMDKGTALLPSSSPEHQQRLAYSSIQVGALEDAAALYSSLLDQGRRSDDSLQIGSAAYNLAVCKESLADTKAARSLGNEALASMESKTDRAVVELFLARLLLREKRYTDAARAAEKVLSQVDSRKSAGIACDTHLLLADIALKQGALSDATEQLSRVDALVKKLGKGTDRDRYRLRVKSGLLFSRKEFGKAAEHFDALVVLCRAGGDYRAVGMALEGAAQSYQSDGNKRDAAERYFRAGRTFHYNDLPKRSSDNLQHAKALSSSLSVPIQLALETLLSTRL